MPDADFDFMYFFLFDNKFHFRSFWIFSLYFYVKNVECFLVKCWLMNTNARTVLMLSFGQNFFPACNEIKLVFVVQKDVSLL